jgi:scyllo-inositol 2-dehydrogenase (NADP+)
MDVKLGILGFGGMGKWHEKNASKIKGVEVTALCDIDPNKIEGVEDKNYEIYTNVDEMLAKADVNTVLLTVPNYLHKEMAIKVANANKNIIDEKPAALNVKEFDEIVAAAKKNQVFLFFHQNRRWDKDYRIIKKLIDEKSLGDVYQIESHLDSANGLIHEWHLYKKYGGGMMYDWGIHLIDQALQLNKGAILQTVYADLKSVINDEVDDYFNLQLKFNNGISYTIELGTYFLKPHSRWLMAGNRGTVYINSFAGDGAIVRTSEVLEKLPAEMAETVAGPTRQFAPQPAGVLYEDALPEVETDWSDFYRNIVDVVNGNAESVIHTEEVRQAMEVLEACFKSNETNQSVSFNKKVI